MVARAGEPYPVSALHGRGSGDLLDEILARLPEVGSAEVVTGPRRVAIVGRPNVGKSSLLNKLAGSQRAVVDSVAGTTVDPVDEVVTIAGQTWLFVDTAGIRRRVKGSQRPRILRITAHAAGDRAGRSGAGGDRRQRAGLGTGRPHHPDGHRGRPGAGHRVLQVGSHG